MNFLRIKESKTIKGDEMIRNVAIKKALKETIFPILSLLNHIIPKKDNIVLLYSANGGIEHSLIPLKEYLLEHNYDRDYTIYCGIKNKQYREKDTRLHFINHFKSIYIYLNAVHVFYTTGQIPIKPSKKQCVIHLRHGNANFKASGKNTSIHNGDDFYFTYMIASSPLFVPSMAHEFGCDEKDIVVAGDPMIDQLLKNNTKQKLPWKYEKTLLWLPTFRQSDYLGYHDSSYENVVPLFQEEEYEELNACLMKYNIGVIVKPHNMQKSVKTGAYSHLKILRNEDLLSFGLELYSLMSQVDGLIGDYSSASLQYLMTDRPQAYVIPDITEYGRKRGFIFDHPENYMAGWLIKSKEEFYQFILDFFEGKDPFREKRNYVRDLVYQYQDARNCERIVRLSKMKEG